MEEEGHAHHEHSRPEHEHQHAHHEANATHPKTEKVFEINSKLILAIIVIAILAVTVYARLGLMGSQGLFEPDGFFYYSIIRSTLANNLHESQHLGISGFPSHNFIGEAPGLPFLTVIFYLLTGWSGVGYLTIMQLLPVFFGILEVILAYFLAKELSNSRLCGLLAMIFVGISAGNIARTAALVYRGDTFIAVPLMFALLVMLKGLKLQDEKKALLYALFAAFVLSTGVLVWNGAQYIVAIYMLSLVLLLLYAFIAWKPELSRRVLIFTAAFFLIFILQSAYLYLGGARPGLAFEGSSILPFYLPILLAALLAFWLSKKGRIGMLHSATGRAIAAAVLVLVVGALVFFAFRGYVTTIASSAGVSQATSISQAVGSTTQELQKPTYSFLFASFEETVYLLFIGAIGIVFLMRERILALLGGSRKRTLLAVAAAFLVVIAVDLFVFNGSGLPGFLHQFKYIVGYISLLAYMLLVFYLFRKSSSNPADRNIASLIFMVTVFWLLLGWIGIWYFVGNWQTPLYLTLFSFLTFGVIEYEDRSGENDVNMVPYIVLLSYLMITAYLQFNAIRYNSLLSIPLALFAAFGLFIIIERIGRIKLTEQTMQYIFAVAVVAVLIVIAWFWLRNIIGTGNALPATNFAKNWYLFDGYASVVVMLAIAAFAILPIFTGKPTDLKRICLISVVMLLLVCTVFTIVESYSSSQADGINPSFLSAMTWLKTNTAVNATVLALWPDGSVVEGWANRTSYMDSVGGENGTRIYYFARYLENTTPDSQYLYGIGKPQYLVARQYWLTELSGLAAEGVPQNKSNYTFASLSLTTKPQQNATSIFYFFGNGCYNVTLVNTIPTNTVPLNYTAYLGVTPQCAGGQVQTRLYKISRVTIYNTSSTRYQEYRSAGYQYKYTLMLFIDAGQLEGSIVMPNGLYDSNLFRLVWLCNSYECPASSANATLTPVFFNNDTRIFKVTYT